MSIELLYPFTTPANYTFDSDLIEVAGGKAKLKDQRPADATFHANYDADINGNWGDGVLTGTPIGGAAVSDGKLDLKYGDIRYVDYAVADNADSLQTGCVRLTVTPNYSGVPASTINFWAITTDPYVVNNLIGIRHLSGSGGLQIQVADSAGSWTVLGTLPAWSPTVSQAYEIELNWDITTGATRLFIDGIQWGLTQTGTGVRIQTCNKFRVGGNFDGTAISNFEIDNVIVYSTVQHTADYTPGQPIPTLYTTTNPQLVCNATFRHEGLDAFTETKSAAGSDEIKYILKKGTVKYYWTGSAWAVSDGTYAQSNTAAEIETNKATFTDTAVTTEVNVLIHSDDGSTTPELDVLQIDYDFSGSNPDSIDTCIVWGYQVQSDAEPDPQTIKVALINDAIQYKTNITIMKEDYEITPDSNGYWEIELVETENMVGTQRYRFEIDGEVFDRGVPDEISASFYELN